MDEEHLTHLSIFFDWTTYDKVIDMSASVSVMVIATLTLSVEKCQD